MRTRWTRPLLMVPTLAVGLSAGCERKGEQDEVTVLKLAHGLDVTHPVHQGMVFMAERVKEKSGGKLRIDIYPSEQLGTERECIEQIQIGALAMTKTSTGPMEGFVPQMKKTLCPVLGIEETSLGIKPRTHEGLGEIGRGEAMAAWAVVLIHIKD